MYTNAFLEFPQIDSLYAIKCWCPSSLQSKDNRSWRFFENAKTPTEPMYVALNTPGFRDSVKKINWGYLQLEQEKLRADKFIKERLLEINNTKPPVEEEETSSDEYSDDGQQHNGPI